MQPTRKVQFSSLQLQASPCGPSFHVVRTVVLKTGGPRVYQSEVDSDAFWFVGAPRLRDGAGGGGQTRRRMPRGEGGPKVRCARMRVPFRFVFLESRPQNGRRVGVRLQVVLRTVQLIVVWVLRQIERFCTFGTSLGAVVGGTALTGALQRV